MKPDRPGIVLALPGEQERAWERPFGAVPVEKGVEFRVWAPEASQVAVRARDVDQPLETRRGEIWEGVLDVRPGDDYRYVLDGGRALPDPCSRFQPGGVLGPSRVVDMDFEVRPGPALPSRISSCTSSTSEPSATKAHSRA